MIHRISLLMAILACSACGTGCATETRVVRDDSANAKFARLFGGDAAVGADSTSGGWSVTRNDVEQPKQKVTPGALAIAKLLKERANSPGVNAPPPISQNPSNIRIITSFNTDPSANQPQPYQPAAPVTPTSPNPSGGNSVFGQPMLPGQ